MKTALTIIFMTLLLSLTYQKEFTKAEIETIRGQFTPHKRNQLSQLFKIALKPVFENLTKELLHSNKKNSKENKSTNSICDDFKAFFTKETAFFHQKNNLQTYALDKTLTQYYENILKLIETLKAKRKRNPLPRLSDFCSNYVAKLEIELPIFNKPGPDSKTQNRENGLKFVRKNLNYLKQKESFEPQKKVEIDTGSDVPFVMEVEKKQEEEPVAHVPVVAPLKVVKKNIKRVVVFKEHTLGCCTENKYLLEYFVTKM